MIPRLLPLVVAWAGLRDTWASSAANGAGDGAISFTPRLSNKVYDTKPKIRIKGTAFGQLSTEDLQQLVFEPPMTVDGEKLFEATVEEEDTILLELAPGKRWPVSESNGVLKLVGASHGGEALLTGGPVTVAAVIPTPTVYPSTNLLYITKSPRVMVNGTNFDAKSTVLYFSPPLLAGSDIDIFVKSSNLVWVSLVQKADRTKWADEPGPLKLVAIDTGAGRMLLREDLGGVTIAEMQADMKGHDISVENHEEVSMYQSTKVLTISGSGFNPEGTNFRFGNNFNYSVEVTPESATFTLDEGNKWKLNAAALPGPLVLLAADAGSGFVPLGATTAKSGRKVATIFEDPSLEESHKEIGRTLTHEMYIAGSGFTKVFPPILILEPHMEQEDFVVQVMNRTSIKVSLAGKGSEGRGWMPAEQTGELYVRKINTGAGMFEFEKPVPVAVVVADDAPHLSGIRIFPNHEAKLYQSSDKALIIDGEGFPMDKELKLVFGFGGPTEESFTCATLSETTIEVKLVAGHKWASVSGPLSLLKASFGDDESFTVDYSSPGLKLATILDDPFVLASHLQVYASHTKQVTIQGQGFFSSFNHHDKPQVVLSPTGAGQYYIKDGGWTDITITFSLTPIATAMWANVLTEGDTQDMKVVSIDTGGGPVPMPGGGIVVAEVRADDESFSCEDSCIYANDGECDENQTGVDGLGWSHYESSNGKESFASSSRGFSSMASASRGGYLGYSTMMDASDDQMAGSPSCPLGTDCTDCGLAVVEEGKCNNDCIFSRDGVCDDRRAMGACPDGTDCQDCGPWGKTNFTKVETGYDTLESTMSFDQDDVGFLADADHPLLIGQEVNAMGRYKRVFSKHRVIRKENDQAEGIFMESLWAATVIVGVSVTIFVGVLLVRCVRGEKIDLPIPTNPDVERSRR
eukprot:g7511.t1